MGPDHRELDLQVVEQRVVELVRELVMELGVHRAILAVDLSASLDKDLGLGSLERVELLLRMEKAFSVHLSDQAMARVETPRGIVQEILKAGTASQVSGGQRRRSPLRTSLSPVSASTLDGVLERYAEKDPSRPHIYLQLEDGKEEVISYGQLYESSLAVASGFRVKGLAHGETVGIMLPTGKAFFSAFFGVLLAGGIPVPIYPPHQPDRIEDYARRQAHTLRNAQVRFLLTFQRVQSLANLLKPFVPTLRDVTTIENLEGPEIHTIARINQGGDAALVQYTSGSTSDPKGVLLTHENILSNIQAMGKAAKISQSDVGVSWLPLYHDMGLIGSWLLSLFYGFPIVILSPFSFLTRPERWLWAIHYHRATLSAGPNFAYELCSRRIEEASIEGLDLSSWRLAFNGAEAISPDTLSQFTNRFRPYGFRPEALFPVYGLAETSVALTFPPLGRPPRVDRITREVFQRERRAEPASPSDTAPLKLVACGFPLPGHEIRIVNEGGVELGDRMEGTLQFKGPSSMKGYFEAPEATRQVYHDGWWDTGDLAYCVEGEVYITGRQKDLIIKAGRNFYPQEIEELASSIEGIRKGCVAAFGVSEPRLGTERLVLVAETRERDSHLQEQLVSQVIEHITNALGIPPDDVFLVSPGAVPKTSSGKLQRARCRELYLQGLLTRKRPPAWLQITRLFVSGLGARFFIFSRVFIDFLYALYVGLIVIITVTPVWLALLLSPRRGFSARLARFWAKGFLKLVACPLKVQGKGARFLEKNINVVWVANHASYLDSVVLMAVLPPNVLFVAKEELMHTPIIRTFIKRVGHLTVDREDWKKGVSETKKMEEALRRGSSVLVFPEGTFTPVAGLRPFKLGAFKAAVETSVPIITVSLSGTRKILWPERWLPRRGSISVVIGEPIYSHGSDWHEITRLRDMAKSEITKHCGENALQ